MSSKSLTAVLAGAAAVLAVAVGVAVTIVVLDSSEASTAAPATTTTVITAAPSTATTAPLVETPADVEPTIDTPSGSLVAEGGECYPSEVRNFGTDASGRSLVCASMGSAAPPRWVTHGADDGSVHSIGELCDSSVESVSRDPNGQAILCSGTWQAGP